ncbi:MAG: glycosyltransferase [Gallionella sp.]
MFSGVYLIGITLIGMAVSFLSCYLLLHFDDLHLHLSSDVGAGPQKFHAQPTPRIGGISIALGLAASYLYLRLTHLDSAVITQYGYLMAAALPAFAGGLVEDLTKKVSVTKRLVLSLVSAGMGVWLLGAVFTHLGFAAFDWLLQWPLVAIALTLFAVGGVVNAVNIIDGFNGIVSGFAGFALVAIALVSFKLNDVFLLVSALAMLGTLLGFLYWNYPHGKIFLGDGGSYLIGFWLAELAVLLLVRHPDVSPWFSILILIHPVFETLFSIYRRKFLHGKSPWHPDGLHLHTLVFRRLNHTQWASQSVHHKVRCNSMTAPYFWIVKAATAFLAVVFWNNSLALILSVMLFSVLYVWLYWRIVKFKTPRWMVKRDRRRMSATLREVQRPDATEGVRERRAVNKFGFTKFNLTGKFRKRDRRFVPVSPDQNRARLGSDGVSNRPNHAKK